MKMAFICNQNQARSQVLSAVFSKILPSWEISSYGLIAREETPLPLVVESIFQDWGLDYVGRFARNLFFHWDEIMELDSVVTVNSFIAEEVKALGFCGDILDLESEASRLSIDLMDPQIMPRRQCAFEIAKYVKVAVSVLQSLGAIKRSASILALIPENEAAIEKATAIALASENIGTSVLLGDLIAPPSSTYLQKSYAIARFKVEESFSWVEKSSSHEGPWVYLPRTAAVFPARVYLSKYWQEFVLGITAESLIIVTPPQKSARGELVESYLSALYANEIRVIQS